mmetsp:Transcript_47925/g.112687  ORF Transcript_47925/g.112687 Transcript_47925/m.112687 type:complete len:254 (+) Transcript_47925:51-812(+)
MSDVGETLVDVERRPWWLCRARGRRGRGCRALWRHWGGCYRCGARVGLQLRLAAQREPRELTPTRLQGLSEGGVGAAHGAVRHVFCRAKHGAERGGGLLELFQGVLPVQRCGRFVTGEQHHRRLLGASRSFPQQQRGLVWILRRLWRGCNEHHLVSCLDLFACFQRSRFLEPLRVSPALATVLVEVGLKLLQEGGGGLRELVMQSLEDFIFRSRERAVPDTRRRVCLARHGGLVAVLCGDAGQRRRRVHHRSE